MFVTQRTMERRIASLEQKLDELSQFIVAQARKEKRRSRRHRQRKRSSGEENESSVVGGSDSSSDSRATSRSSSRSTTRDFGGRKLKIPVFRGEDAYGWIVRTERYFKLNQVDEEEKLDAVMIALEDQALSWYQWWEEQNEEHTWENFKAAAIRRFQPGLVQNPFGPLLSIKQTSSVMRYREKFEREAAPLKKEERVMLKGIFINGLKEEIQAELKLHGTGSLEELMDRALLLEEKNTALRKSGLRVEEKADGKEKGKGVNRGFQRGQWTYGKWDKGMGSEKREIKKEEGGSSEKKTWEGGRLSQTELRDRSRKGLCFKCGEKWGHDHICKMKHYQICLVEKEETEEEEEKITESEEEESSEVLTSKKMRLSLKSKEGLTSNKSFKTMGEVGGEGVLILIDCGASANFISKKLVDKLQLTVWDTPEYLVELGNGAWVKGHGICKNVEVMVQGVPIKQNFYLMELGGTDLVLGMVWLESLGDIRANFKNMSLSWGKKGERHRLQGDPSLSRTKASWKTMRKALQNEGEGFMLTYNTETEAEKGRSIEGNPLMEDILEEFEELFREPEGLPPKRRCDHAILLKEGSNIPHIRPYSFTGNKLNCGLSYQHLCASNNAEQGSSHKSKLGLIVGVVIGLILILFLGGLLFFWCKGYKREVFVDVAGEVDRRITFGQIKRFSLRELQIATDNFSEKNVLGQGGFGKVYKGVLVDGTKVAVKRLTDYESPGGDAAFQREVEMISVAVHRNLLRLIGFCTTPTERLLVYPFMQNLSVAYRLRERKPGEPVLDWATRKRVALGTARGLEYLHEQCDPKIIHRDVKAANILLDGDFEAVVGDFGLAKLVDVRLTNVTTQIRGTMGHIAPEYLSTGKSSERTDVFSYGIMLLELVTGQRAIDFSRLEDEDDVLLLDHVKKLQREKKLDAIVDRNLNKNYNIEDVEMIVQVALLCTQASPEDRPAMSEVVRMLEGEGLAQRWEEWQHVEVTQRQDYERLQRRLEWGDDSVHNQDAMELSGGR